MNVVKTIFALFIALTVVGAPLGSAWAALRIIGSPLQAALIDTSTSAAVTMVDCEKMMAKSPGLATKDADCPCCDTKSACPPDACPMKIFKVFGIDHRIAGYEKPRSSELRSLSSLKPPDWMDCPQPPPPRA